MAVLFGDGEIWCIDDFVKCLFGISSEKNVYTVLMLLKFYTFIFHVITDDVLPLQYL